MTIFDASVKYAERGVPLVILAGKEYGSGSSRDWAAKGPKLLGVRAVIAESYERIHRSNLVGMGILPLQFERGRVRSRWADRRRGIRSRGYSPDAGAEVCPGPDADGEGDGSSRRQQEFNATVRIDTPQEILYYENGGILQYVLRQLAAN